MTLAGDFFLEGDFAYSVYDFIEYKKETGQYWKIKRKYRGIIDNLEKISKEAFYADSEREETRRAIKNLIDENDVWSEIFEKNLKFFLLAFYKRRIFK